MTKDNVGQLMEQLPENPRPAAVAAGLHESLKMAPNTAASEGVIVTDATGVVESANNAAASIFGATSADIVGTHVGNLLYQPGQDAHETVLGDYMGTTCAQPIFGHRSDGTTIPLTLTVTEIEHEGARSFVGVVRVVSSRDDAYAARERFFSMTTDMLCIVGFDGYARDVNDAWRTTLGWTFDELRTTPLVDIVHEDDREVTSVTQQLTETATTEKFENRCVRKDGTYRWIQWTATSVIDEELIYLAGRDVTEYKEAEARLRRSEEYFAAFTNNSAAGCFMKDAEGRYIYVNDRWTELFGLKPDVVLGRTDADFRDAELAARLVEHDARVRELNETLETVNTIRDGDGVDRHFLSFKFPIGERSENQLIGGVFLDATTEQQAQRALAQSEELHRSVIAAIEEGVLIEERDGAITTANESAERILGLSQDQIRGRNWIDESWRSVRRDGSALPPHEHPAAITLETGASQSNSIIGVHRPTGELRWLSLNSRPLFHEGEEQPFAAVTSFADVSERLEISRMKDEFISVVSHELRTPLTSIHGALGLLAGGAVGELEPKPQRMVDIAVDNTDRLIRLINDVLDIERMESGKVTMERQDSDTQALVEKACEVMRPLAAQHEVTIEVCATQQRAWVDPDRIVQTLTNLIGNAIKFSPQGGTVKVVAEDSGGELVFRVIDEGRGVPADRLERIFERFEQVDASDSREKGGTGLGLAICRSIVEQHEGRIWVESELGEGATFSFTANAKGHGAAADQPIAAPPPRKAALVCHANADVGQSIADLASARSIDVVATQRSAEMAALISAHEPSVVLIDLELEGREASDAIEAVRAHPGGANTPIVLFNGDVATDDVTQPTDVAGIVEKPLDGQALLSVLDGVFQDSNGPCVLLVEDDPSLAGVLVEVLGHHGIEVEWAPTAADAKRMAFARHPDFVVLDLRLPDADGYAVADAFREHDELRRVPLVVYTVLDLNPEQRARLRLGDTTFLTKGKVSPAEFGAQVAELLSRVVPAPERVAA